MKLFLSLMLILLGGCTTFNTGGVCGSFPNRPDINYIENEGQLVEAFGKMKFYIVKTEKAKMECEYVN